LNRPQYNGDKNAHDNPCFYDIEKTLSAQVARRGIPEPPPSRIVLCSRFQVLHKKRRLDIFHKRIEVSSVDCTGVLSAGLASGLSQRLRITMGLLKNPVFLSEYRRSVTNGHLIICCSMGIVGKTWSVCFGGGGVFRGFWIKVRFLERKGFAMARFCAKCPSIIRPV
jgi:hypothetical protein